MHLKTCHIVGRRYNLRPVGEKNRGDEVADDLLNGN